MITLSKARFSVRISASFIAVVTSFAVLGLFAPSFRLLSVAYATMLLVVTLHETAHIVVAALFGAPTRSISLTWAGESAEIPHIERLSAPKQAMVALAGPFLNILIFIVSVSLYPNYHRVSLISFGSSPVVNLDIFYTLFIVSNIVIGSFNLLPVYPMDGGRFLIAITSAVEKDLIKVCFSISRCVYIAIIAAGFFINIFYFFGMSIIIVGMYIRHICRAEIAAYKERAWVERTLKRLYEECSRLDIDS